MERPFDLVVIGTGSGGAVAAEFAADVLGVRVAAVEREAVGGDRLWSGSVPSKALLASAGVAHVTRHGSPFGVEVPAPRIDLPAVWERVRQVRTEMADRFVGPTRLAELGVELVRGTATVTGAREVTVEGPDGRRVLRTRYVLVATGSRPAIPELDGLEELGGPAALDPTRAITTDSLFELEQPPASVVMIGGGPVGVELAQTLARLGVPTTVVEAAPRLLPREEPDLSERLTEILRRDGVVVRLGAAATSLRVEGSTGDPSRVTVTTAAGESISAAGVLLATGRVPSVEGLGLERFGIHVGPSGVPVDGRNRTIVPNVYVVGDAAAGRPRFAHAAATDAVLAVRDMFLPGRGRATPLVPWCTFTDPELGHAGMTASEARQRFGDRAVTVHRRDLSANERAVAEGRTDGAMLVVTVRDRIVGAHVLAPHAGELVNEFALAIRLGLRLRDLADMVHVSPTYSSTIARLATDDVYARTRRSRAFVRLNRWFG
jgi:pyruvate/2-oxoglutarate dehydrogenase complex dihydrolipoamide dehydrogenase (E3) component